MVGIRLMIIMAIVGGFIAYLADHLGSKIGKKKMSVFGLRPKHTALLLTVLSGVLISLVSIGVVSVTSESARTALFGMEKIQAELKSLNSERDLANKALEEAKVNVEKQNSKIQEKNDEEQMILNNMEKKIVNKINAEKIINNEDNHLSFYQKILLDNVICEYSNLITIVEGLEKDNGSNS